MTELDCSPHDMAANNGSWRNSRWIPILGGMMLEICGGSIYITGLYTNDLKHRFFKGEHAQSQMEQLVFACNLGNWLPAAGFFFDSRLGGGRNTALVAAVLTVCGYLGLWAWSSELIRPAYWQVWIFWFLWGHGSGWFDNAAMSVTARNFPLHKGRAMALMKSFYGLSGSILTQVFNLFFFGQTSGFLLFLGIGLGALGTLCSPLLWLVAPGQPEERDQPTQRFDLGLRLVLTLACFLLGVSVLREALGASLPLNLTSFAVTMVFLSLLLLMLRGAVSGGGPLLATSPPPSMVGRGRELAAPDGTPLGQALRRADFWLLFVIVFAGMGSGLVVLNHVGQMASALGHDASTTVVLVSLISIANCFGRVLFGILPDMGSGKVPRPIFCMVNLAVMSCAQLLLAVGATPALFTGSIVAGFSYGGFWTLMPSLVSELFGTATFATLYNFQSLAVSSSSFVFSTSLAARFYDSEASLHPAPSGSGCAGSTCYRKTSLMMACMCVVGMVAAAVLHGLTRRR